MPEDDERSYDAFEAWLQDLATLLGEPIDTLRSQGYEEIYEAGEHPMRVIEEYIGDIPGRPFGLPLN